MLHAMYSGYEWSVMYLAVYGIIELLNYPLLQFFRAGKGEGRTVQRD